MPFPTTPAERRLHASMASNVRWSRVDDRTAATEPMRRAFLERFERDVDPDGVLSPAERARRADNARSAHYAALALKSAQARRRKAAARGGVEGARPA